LRAADEAYEGAMRGAGRLLAVRARSRGELRERLAAAGHARPVVERVLARVEALGLVDDRAFARQWVTERGRRGLSRAALVRELVAKGVDRDVAEAAADAGVDDDQRAADLAARRLARMGHLPLRTQAARLHGALLRRGFSEEVAEATVRSVLPPDGWD
jgi:regulatory protein